MVYLNDRNSLDDKKTLVVPRCKAENLKEDSQVGHSYDPEDYCKRSDV
jgi:hypothetical protein